MQSAAASALASAAVKAKHLAAVEERKIKSEPMGTYLGRRRPRRGKEKKQRRSESRKEIKRERTNGNRSINNQKRKQRRNMEEKGTNRERETKQTKH